MTDKGNSETLYALLTAMFSDPPTKQISHNYCLFILADIGDSLNRMQLDHLK